MRHFPLPVQNNHGLPVWYSLFVFVLFLLHGGASSLAAETPAKNTITAVKTVQKGDALNITLQGTVVPTYTVYELFKPARIVVDIADSAVAPGTPLTLPTASRITLTTSTITDTTPSLTRFTFTLQESRQFSVIQKDNNILLSISAGPQKEKTTAAPVVPSEKGVTEIHDIKVQTVKGETRVQLLGSGKVASYSYDVLDKKGASPPRLYIDINNVTGDTLIKEQKVGTTLAGIRVAKRGTGLRFVFDSSQDTLFPFQVSPLDNGIEIRIQETAQTDDELSELIQRKQTIEDQLPEIDPLQLETGDVNAPSAASSMKDAFNFSGYNKARITVDFYKIDLHNVFRLLREVSKTNIVVDEAVGGSLTLALNDVPWDFALDIILNLKDLQKEERFNTIVILPKSKDFAWPERAEDVLSVDADEDMLTQEALKIEQIENIPPAIIEAKKLIDLAMKRESQGDYENSIELYEQAFNKWEDNSFIANRIASIYLTQLHQNAKAAYFADKALALDNTNSHAALNAAIAYANMGEKKKAQEHFEQSVSGEKPAKEAFLSYSAFIEIQQRYAPALKLLHKQDELYGKDLNSMLARARILDKQGEHETATKEYRAILLSGFRIPQDLKKFITGRISLSQSM